MSDCPSCNGSGYLDARGRGCDEARAAGPCDLCLGFGNAPDDEELEELNLPRATPRIDTGD